MGLSFTHYQAFLRVMLQNGNADWEADADLVRRKCEHLLRERFEASMENGSTLISSSMGGDSFSYRVNGSLSEEGIIDAATRALELIDRFNPKTRTGYDALTDEQKAASNVNALGWIRMELRRTGREQGDFTWLRH